MAGTKGEGTRRSRATPKKDARFLTGEDPWLKNPDRWRRSDYNIIGSKAEESKIGQGVAIKVIAPQGGGGNQKNLKAMGDRLNGYVSGRIRAGSKALVKATALSIIASLVEETPADTGRAISNWQLTVEAPYEGLREAYAPGQGGSTSQANRDEAIKDAEASAEDYDGVDYASIYISNNLKYIAELNNGWSAQAPRGFIEAAVAAGKATVNEGHVL